MERKSSGARTLEWKQQVLASSKTPEPVKAEEPVPESQQPTQANVAPAPTVPAAEGEDKSLRPTYAERRVAAISAGAAPIPAKIRKTKVQLLWIECRPKSFIQDDEGRTAPFKEPIRPTCFRTEADAVAANELFKQERGYAEEIVYCEVHHAWHLRHIYSVRSTPVEHAMPC